MVKDIYPSRVSETPKMMERQDPVIHNREAAKDGPLTNNQLDFYEKNGYIMLEKFFDGEDLKMLKEELDQKMKENEDRNGPDVIKEPNSNEVRSIFEIHKDEGFFERLSRDERLVKIIEQILGSEVYINQSRINFKPGFKGKEFYWHSDFETWHVEDGMPRMRALSCSIVLTDNYEYNGPLMLVPGSQDYYVSTAGETPDKNYESSLQKQEVGVPDEKSMEWLVEQAGGQIDRATGPAGSVLLFDCNTMHGSAGNISPYPRSNVFFVYNSIHNKLEQPFNGKAPRPEFLANRENIKPITPVSGLKQTEKN
ncbi:ectoine hydroxylase [Alkalicoccus halolimnae]|uniref:Ectoine hydroxylase n=1 Tax=Alkalicoccus halolimnae TaxID=1667239 RepID=A0A5C7FEX9_9BACI|nr:ectoine hydroxylase [Alkalicoccus halolimnae]TXF82733.1 ectoine hydroxylase [Alkalicoccus halolimnae]